MLTIGYDKILFVDTETTGLDVFKNGKIYGISWALGDREPNYIDVRSQPIHPFVEDFDKCEMVVAHGTKFDAHALNQVGVDITKKKLDCTIVRAQLLDENKLNYDLGSLTGKKEKIIDDLAEMFGGKATKNVQMQNLHKAPYEFVKRYAVQDVVAMRHLFNEQEKEEMPGVHELEREVLKTLILIERKGVRVDIGKTEKALDKVGSLIVQAQEELNKLAGKQINVNSSPQMNELLVIGETKTGKFRLIDGTLADRTGKGVASITAGTLEEMTHPMSDAILRVRKYTKIRDTFLVSQILGHNVNGRIHPNYNQTRVVTGRLSCSAPNLQAVPKRDPEMKAILRPLFLPEDGYTLLKCDYEQSDIRGFAHYISGMWTGNEEHPVLRAYKEDPLMDFHGFVSEMMGIRRNPGPGGQPNAKQINLAMIFNMGAGKLAKQMGMPYIEEVGKNGKIYLKPGKEAEEIFYKYHHTIPGAADMGKIASSRAASRGYVVSIAGRRLRFPNKYLTYKASGYLYQSFTADLIKAAMVEVSKVVPWIHMQIHDELVCSVDDEKQVWDAKEAMEEGVLKWIKTGIPIRTLPECGPNWGETKKIEKEKEHA